MYKSIFRPVLFRFNPESVHHGVFMGLKVGQFIGLPWLLNNICNRDSLQMETIVAGIKFPNKIGIAAGLDKNAEGYKMLGALGFGHIEIGTVTPKGQSGNPKPRLFRLVADKAIINRMGFNNQGLEATIKKLKNKHRNLIVGGNIGKNTLTPNNEAINDYLACFVGLYPYVDYITVNVSCPNITDLHKLQDQDQLELILQALNDNRAKQSTYKPIFLKISPDLNNGQLDSTLEVVQKCGIDGVIATNTTVTRSNLSISTDKIQQIGNGGLSGQPIKSRSTEVVRYIAQKTKGKLPIIAVGGIFTALDAIEKLDAGASLVQVYSGFIYEGPAMACGLNRKIKAYYSTL
jgi:dihydroorotate dehydrogenase